MLNEYLNETPPNHHPIPGETLMNQHTPVPLVAEPTKPEALKYDAGKVPLHLIDPLWLEATAQVLAFGAKKYQAWNWAQGTFDWSRLYGALQRHLNAWWSGEEHDPETGLPHLWHANCCLMFLTRYAHSGWGTDDRFPFSSVKASGETRPTPAGKFPPQHEG